MFVPVLAPGFHHFMHAVTCRYSDSSSTAAAAAVAAARYEVGDRQHAVTHHQRRRSIGKTKIIEDAIYLMLEISSVGLFR